MPHLGILRTRVPSRYEGLVTDVEKKDIGRGPVLIEGRAAAIIRRLLRKEKKALNGNHEYKLWVRKKITYLTINCNNKKICALLDTGCEVSIVGRRILPADVELSPPRKQLFAANRTKIPLLGNMDMEFEVHGERYSVTLAVTDAIDEMILGIDWLTQNAAEWDFGRGELTLRGKGVPLQKRPITNRVRRVYSANTVHIPPMTQADIPVKVTWPTLNPEESDWLVEPTLVDEGLIVARTLVSGEVLDTAVRVINVSGREYVIQCDAELGKACEVTETLAVDEESSTIGHDLPPTGHYRSPPGHRRSSASHQRCGDISSTVGHNRSPTGPYRSPDRSRTGIKTSDAEVSSEDSTDATWMSIRERQNKSNEEERSSGEPPSSDVDTSHVDCLIDQLQSNLSEQQKEVAERMRQAYAIVRQNLKVCFERSTRRYDARVKATSLEVGESRHGTNTERPQTAKSQPLRLLSMRQGTRPLLLTQRAQTICPLVAGSADARPAAARPPAGLH